MQNLTATVRALSESTVIARQAARIAQSEAPGAIAELLAMHTLRNLAAANPDVSAIVASVDPARLVALLAGNDYPRGVAEEVACDRLSRGSL